MDTDGIREALALEAPTPIFTSAPQWPVCDDEFEPFGDSRPDILASHGPLRRLSRGSALGQEPPFAPDQTGCSHLALSGSCANPKQLLCARGR